jgi:NusA-like KH domain protein
MTIINMQTMRYINLLDRASKVKTKRCFVYNNVIVFAVPRELVSRAIGHDAENVKMIQEQLGKKIKIISDTTGKDDAERFISDIVAPVRFKSIEFKDGECVITAGNPQTKAALLGRNKVRLEELKTVVEDAYSAQLKVI